MSWKCSKSSETEKIALHSRLLTSSIHVEGWKRVECILCSSTNFLKHPVGLLNIKMALNRHCIHFDYIYIIWSDIILSCWGLSLWRYYLVITVPATNRLIQHIQLLLTILADIQWHVWVKKYLKPGMNVLCLSTSLRYLYFSWVFSFAATLYFHFHFADYRLHTASEPKWNLDSF